MGSQGPADRGVSEFTGVAILVAVTVLVTASVGLLVLVTDAEEPAPTDANFSFQYIDSSGVLIVTHERGYTFDAGNLTVRSREAEVPWYELAGTNESAPVGPGATVQLSRNNAYGQTVNEGDDVRVVYTPPTGNETVLERWTGP